MTVNSGCLHRRFAWFICLTLVMMMFLNACGTTPVRIYYPAVEGDVAGQFTDKEITSTYRKAFSRLMWENSQRHLFKKIDPQKVNFYPSESIAAAFRKNGMEALQQALDGEEDAGAIFTQIIRPYKDHPFYYCKMHLYVKHKGLRAHESSYSLIEGQAFETEEFWKAEFQKLLLKMDNAL